MLSIGALWTKVVFPYYILLIDRCLKCIYYVFIYLCLLDSHAY
jgi:hypothetical protein